MDERTQSAKNSSPAAKLIASQVETALKALAKLLVSMRFYPVGHPSLKDVTSDAQAAFVPLLQTRESLVVIIRRTGFFYEDEAVGNANAMLQKFAASLFARKIPQLLILKDLSCRDLWETAKILLLDAEVVQKGGGIQALLQQARVTTIWTNVIDIKGIFELKKELETEKETLFGATKEDDEEFLASLGAASTASSGSVGSTGAAVLTPAAPPPAGELPFDELLKAVETASGDQEFCGLLQRLTPVVLANLNDSSAHLVLQTLSFLAYNSVANHVGEVKRQAVGQAMVQLSSPALLGFYVNLLCARVRYDEHRIVWEKINQSLGLPLVGILLSRLSDEEDAAVRKVLFEALISQGKLALPAIFETLQEDRWPVLRNATYLLGEIRDPTAIEPLRALLRHRDLRVRREALRALTRIGGNSVIAIIAKILGGDDGELRRQAMLCLGAIKSPGAIPLLVQFLQVKDWKFQELEAKIDAVRALGEIGSADALPALISVVEHRCLFYRSRNDELRAAALLALGEIGGSEAIALLESLENASRPIVARAASSALKEAKKGQRHD